MILTVNLNPAVDKNCRLETLTPGEVNRLKQAKNVAGGKGVNVAKILRLFHTNVAAVGFLGGDSGRFIEETLERLGVSCYFTKIKGTTRTNVNLLGEDGLVTELLEPGPTISPAELKDFRRQFHGCLEFCDLVVLTGSVPTGVPATIYQDLTCECHACGRKVILDASGEALKHGIEGIPDIIKPNRMELESLYSEEAWKNLSLEKKAGHLTKKGIGQVFVSLGAEGLFFTDGENTVTEPAKEVKVVNTVGCGDSVVASLCMSLLAGEDAETTLRKATALAAANATTSENGEFPIKTYLDLL